MNEAMRDLTNIAVLFIAVAALALLVSHPAGTGTLIGTAGGTFNQALSTVENPSGGGTGNYNGGGMTQPQALMSTGN